jgi:rRNA maturation endonuclease Nob1
MGSAWVVDSNCFIHLGQKGEDDVLADLTSALGGGKMLITPGVEDEVATVRMRRMDGRPRLLDVFAPILKSVPVDEEDVRSLAAKIGERASPQDVDLSLMVLAHSLGEAGGSVLLVSDDFKMATTAETADLAFDSCPPSTFIERLVENGGDAARDARLRSLSRQVRASEMKYAISRREDYDVQRKLTWMVDSLLGASHDVGTPEEGPDEARKVADLTRTIRGYRVKPKRLEALGGLPDVCAPVQRLDAHLEGLRTASEDDIDASRAATRALLAEVMEAVGLALAPLEEGDVELVHRAMAGEHAEARSHLVRALHLATLVDDVGAERKAMRRLGVLALHAGNLDRAYDLCSTAAEQPAKEAFDALPSLVLAGITARLLERQDEGERWINAAAKVLAETPGKGAAALDRVGQSLLAVDRPDLAIELFDEAVECALLGGNSTQVEASARGMVQAELAFEEGAEPPSGDMRRLLDRLTPVGDGHGKAEAIANAQASIDEA